MITKYPMFNKNNELIGNCSLDDVYNGDMSDNDPCVICEDLKGNAYEVSAWGVERILNFSDSTMPRMYARML